MRPSSLTITIPFLLAVPFLGRIWWNSARASAPPTHPEVRVQAASDQSITIVLDTPSYTLRDITRQGQRVQQLAVAGWGNDGRPGMPQVPVRSVMVAIPPYATLSANVQAQDVETLPGRHQLALAPLLVAEPVPGYLPRARRLAVDAGASGHTAPPPPAWATVGRPAWIRQQRVVVVHLRPFRYEPATGTIRVAQRLRVMLQFHGSKARRGVAAESAPDDPYAPDLRPYLLNGNMARQWQLPFRSTARRAPGRAAWEPAGHKIFVERDGLYRMTYSDTLAAGIDVAADPRTFRLTQGGEEVALYVPGEEDGSFDPQDEIIFYGQQAHTRYTNRNVYWLSSGGSAGLRMTTEDGTPNGTFSPAQSFTATLPVEENHVYSSISPRGEGHDHWFWDSVLAYSGPSAGTYPFTLTQMSGTPFTATLRGVLAGATSLAPYPDHHTQIYLNGRLVDDATWDGQTLFTFTATVPSNVLTRGGNVISVALPLDLGTPYDYVYVDRFDLQYRRPYTATAGDFTFGSPGGGRWQYRLTGLSTADVTPLDITDPRRPKRVLGTIVEGGPTYTLTFAAAGTPDSRYLLDSPARRRAPAGTETVAPANLRTPTNSADYIMIAHEDFYTAALPLRDYRAAQGMRVRLIRLQDIYDTFSFGLPDPQAIHDFLAYAYDHWTPPAPTFVLLVGDGSLDPKDYLHTGVQNFVPPYLAAADPWINETAADNRYVDVHGDDNLPDMALGRFPANSAAEVAAMISKTLAYEQHPPPGLWNRKALFVADNTDSAGDFAAFSDEVAALLPEGYIPDKVYYGVTHRDVSQARTAILAAINAGPLLVTYAGHASPDAWASESLFGVADLPALTNFSGPWPIMLPMTCYDGFYDYPTIPSLGENIVRLAGGGAVASWSPTGLGVGTGHIWLDRGFMQAVFEGRVDRLGPATMQGLLNLYANTPNFHELIDTYVLFGDPALRLSLPYCDALGAADADCDCRVDAADVQTVADRWHSRPGDERYLLDRDIDANGVINLSDIVRVASRWGATCSRP
ncbi:MAG: hypothetical protein GXP41_08320 [Chloroflexi bacterium]|nr:hypothetical protein [Chloroflexota bacterium]